MNQPRRKSRLRSRDTAPASHRSPAEPPPLGEPGSTGSAETPVYDADLAPADHPAPTAAVEDVTDVPPGTEHPAHPTLKEGEDLPEAFRLNKVYTDAPVSRNPLADWRWLLLLLVLAGLGTLGGYLLGQRSVATPEGMTPRERYVQAKNGVIGAIDPKVEAEVDAAFEATKKGRYGEARERFTALRDKHPEWPSMAVEVARDYLYQHAAQEAQQSLTTLSANHITPDADFMLALLHLTNKEFDLAEISFGNAVAQDPSRPEYYYFWGECLRRDGKPKEAIKRFQSALLRNQYENAEGLYQLKLWLSQIQADQEGGGGASKEIDDALALPRPPYEALFAAAGRALKAHRFDEAAGYIAKAQNITEPAVFRVILQDPAFLEESTRPELAGFYK